jgi:carboxypeptidase T
MPPSGYLTSTGIESCLQYLASTYPSICQLIVLPEASREGRTSRAIKIASAEGPDRRGVLLIGGVHARELVNPDALVSLGLRLCQAYTAGTGLTFGGKSYTSGVVKLMVDAIDLFIFPLVNPDGREYVQSPAGDPWWRKNRSPNAGLPCMGVDLNRNYDFLWSSVIGVTSADSCSDVFHGPSGFSEPETRNVRWILDTRPNVCCMMDVHSYAQLVLHPWGDDELQTTNPAMTFTNPAYNGLRGVVGDTTYREYMAAGDRDWFVSTGGAVRDAIAAAFGHAYTVEQAVYLYPTCGTSKDYSYSRHIVDPAKRKVYAYTLETGTEFQPAFPAASDLIGEIMAGLVHFCIQCMCAADAMADEAGLADHLQDFRDFRNELQRSTIGRRLTALVDDHSAEFLELAAADPKLWKEAVALFRKVGEVVVSRSDPTPKVIDARLIDEVRSFAGNVSRKGSPELRASMQQALSDASGFRGKTAAAAISPGQRPRRGSVRRGKPAGRPRS